MGKKIIVGQLIEKQIIMIISNAMIMYIGIMSESASYRLEGGWIGNFYESLQNVEVSKTNNRNDLVDMQQKINYNNQAIFKYAIAFTYED